MSQSSESVAPKKKRAPRPPRNTRDVFRNITVDQVAGKSSLSEHHIASSIYFDQLSMAGDQKKGLQDLYTNNQVTDLIYTQETQDNAISMLEVHDLHLGVSNNLGTQWTKQWWRDFGGKRLDMTCRGLFQW